MKTIKMLLLVVAITFSSVLSASTAPKNAETNAIVTDVYERLENPSIILEKETLANVTITVNKNNELVVLSVDSENLEIVEFIKSRLNYSKISVELYDKSKKKLARFSDKIIEDIIISASTLPGSHILPKYIAQFREQYPNANFKIVINNSAQSLELITILKLALG